MSRIPLLSTKDANPLARLVYRIARRRYGAVPEPFAVLARHTGLLAAGAVHELAVEKASRTLPVNVRQIALYRVATQLGCSWCVDFGTMLQRHDGLDIDRLRHIDDYATSPHFTRQERLAIAYADAMTTTPVTATDEQVADLEAEFGRKGVLELTYQIALENYRSRLNSALGITAQGFTSGEACRVPLSGLG